MIPVSVHAVYCYWSLRDFHGFPSSTGKPGFVNSWSPLHSPISNPGGPRSPRWILRDLAACNHVQTAAAFPVSHSVVPSPMRTTKFQFFPVKTTTAIALATLKLGWSPTSADLIGWFGLATAQISTSYRSVPGGICQDHTTPCGLFRR